MPTTRQEWIDFLGSRETFTQEDVDAWRKFFLGFPVPDAFRVWEDLGKALKTFNGQSRVKTGPRSYSSVAILFHGNVPEIRDHLGKCLRAGILGDDKETADNWINLVPPS